MSVSGNIHTKERLTNVALVLNCMKVKTPLMTARQVINPNFLVPFTVINNDIAKPQSLLYT